MINTFSPRYVKHIMDCRERIEARASDIGRIVFKINGKRKSQNNNETSYLETLEVEGDRATVVWGWWWGDSKERTYASFPLSYFNMSDADIEAAEVAIKKAREEAEAEKARKEAENRATFLADAARAEMARLSEGFSRSMKGVV